MDIQSLNFSHDLALARNVANYTPPPNVQIMERDLAPLARLLPDAELSYNEHAPVWGWDCSLVRKLRKAGCKGLPADGQLAEIRRLSSRLTAVEMLPAIRARLPEGTTIGESRFVRDIDELSGQFPNAGTQTSILKAPYSGSGRGLRIADTDKRHIQYCKSQISAQGGVVVEPYYINKVADFALEYMATSAGISFAGLSVFRTDRRNVWSGNCIAPQEVLWHKLTALAPHFDFTRLADVVEDELRARFAGRYLGPLGVDMMVVDNLAGEPLIHPCVEVNVRRTMGELSLHILPLLAEGTEGFFSILYDKDSESLRRTVATQPPVVYDGNGRLVSGTHLLTPLHADTHYVAILQA